MTDTPEPVRHTVRLPSELLEAIEEWRARQRPIPSLNGAFVELIRRGLLLKDLLP
jgi:hypothetical protein